MDNDNLNFFPWNNAWTIQKPRELTPVRAGYLLGLSRDILCAMRDTDASDTEIIGEIQVEVKELIALIEVALL